MNSLYNRTMLGLGTLLLLPLATQAQAPVDLRLKFKTGDVSKYQTQMKMTMKMTQPGAKQPMTLPFNMAITSQQKVLRTLPNGGGEVQTTILSQQTTMNGQPSPVGSQTAPPITTTMNARGKVLSVKGGQQTSGGGMMGMNPNAFANMSSGTFLPNRPVRPGETWTQTLRIPGFSNSATARSQFVRVERVGQFNTARIHTTIKAPVNIMLDSTQKPTRSAAAAVMTVVGSFMMNVDSNLALNEGKMVRAGGDGQMAMNMKAKGPSTTGAPQNIKMNMAMHMANTIVP